LFLQSDEYEAARARGERLSFAVIVRAIRREFLLRGLHGLRRSALETGTLDRGGWRYRPDVAARAGAVERDVFLHAVTEHHRFRLDAAERPIQPPVRRPPEYRGRAGARGWARRAEKGAPAHRPPSRGR